MTDDDRNQAGIDRQALREQLLKEIKTDSPALWGWSDQIQFASVIIAYGVLRRKAPGDLDEEILDSVLAYVKKMTLFRIRGE